MLTPHTLEPDIASQLLHGLVALRDGDFSFRLPRDLSGLDGKLADTFNDVIARNERLARELERISRVVGKDGRLDERAALGDVGGSWAASVDSVNALISDLVHPTSETARVIGAVAKGDLSQTMALPSTRWWTSCRRSPRGHAGRARGRHRGQARRPGPVVKGVAGTWKDLTDNVNSMAGNLTGAGPQHRRGDDRRRQRRSLAKITVDVKGEILELKNTINTMVDQLRSFASEVTRVAREVGTEGKLGGQAQVQGVAGTWKDLTDSVNSMAGNLTAQVRNIADVTTAVAAATCRRRSPST
jgi:HAMP domain-containing protein